MDGLTIEARTDVRRTKLLRPRLSNDVIARPRLIERLGNGLVRPFTLLSTPAGYGKTTLLCQWLADSSLRSAWLQLDEQDNALPVFVAELIAAVRTVAPDLGRAAIGLLSSPDLPPPAYIGATLADELLDLPEPLIIVLEDYHAIADPAVHEFLAALLNYPPPSLRLVLSSRVDPPLPVARWRGRDQLTELRAADMRFTMAETQAFLEQAAGQPLSLGVVELLDARIEGWATGLRLVALSLQGAGDPSAVVAAFARRRRQHATRYLLDEVLLGQAPEVQEFLLRTSIVEQVCAPLAEAILDWAPEGDAEALLESLLRSNVFVATQEPASDGREWFRYHPLFRELLQLQLPEREGRSAVEALHRRAATWCLEQGLVEQALRHLLAAGEPEQAARVVEDHRHSLLNREAWDTLARWLQLLPEGLIWRYPGLLLASAWIERLADRWDAMARLIDAAAGLLDRTEASREVGSVEALHGEIDAMRAFSSLVNGDSSAAATAAGRALNHLPANLVYARGDAAIALGLGLYKCGHGAAVRREYATILESHQGPPDAYTLRLLIALSLIQLQSGELHALHQSAERLLTLSAPRGMDFCTTWAHYFLGRVAYEWNDLGGAAEHFFAVTAMRGRCHMAMVREATFDLALTYQAQGRSAEAKALLGELEEFLAATDDDESIPMLSSFRARLALACGARPLPLMPQVAADPRRRWLCGIENSQLTAIRSMLAHGGANEPDAMSLLTNFLVRAERECAVQLQVEALAVQALTQQDRGLEGAALDSLARALVLAEPGGFIRTFIDLGAPLAALLRRLETCRGSSAYVRALLAAMPVPPAELPASPPSPPSPAIPARADSRAATIPSHDAIGDLIEQLTNRELQVLACLDHHLTSKEIAIELSISPLTVKRHISNLSGKLGVSSRRLAVRRARVFGLLPVPVLR